MQQYCSDDGICYGYYDKDGNFITMGIDVVVQQFEKELESNTVYVTVKFNVGDQLQCVRSTLNDIVKSIGKAGYPVSNAQTTSLYQYIQQQLLNMNAKIVHKQLGWMLYEDKPLFRGEVSFNDTSTISSYIGNYDIKHRGKKTEFIKEFPGVIVGNTPLETAVVIGMSAVLVGYISVLFKDVKVPTLIFDINGRSTTGKTTCANLAVSMGGAIKPAGDMVSLSGTCSTTINALYGVLDNNFGFPILFDEISRLGKANMDSMAYSIADGTDKARMNGDGEVKPPKRWATTVIFTGEHRILGDRSVADGVFMRVIPFNNVSWTSSAAQAHAVEAFSTNYAGIGNIVFAEYLARASPNDVIDLYLQNTSSLTTKIPVADCYKERMAKSVSVLVTTAELASKALGIQLNKQKILDFVLENIGGNVPENEAQKAFSFILNKFHINSSKFAPAPLPNSINTDNIVMRSDVWGTIRSVSQRYNKGQEAMTDELVIVKEIFLNWMADGNFDNVENILREWKKLNILHLQKPDRYYSNIVLQNGKPKTVCLRIYINNGVYPSQTSETSDEIFNEVLCRKILTESVNAFAKQCIDCHTVNALQKDVDWLSKGGRLEQGLADEIISACFCVTVDLPKLLSFLHGQDRAEWEKKKKAGLISADNNTQGEQLTLDGEEFFQAASSEPIIPPIQAEDNSHATQTTQFQIPSFVCNNDDFLLVGEANKPTTNEDDSITDFDTNERKTDNDDREDDDIHVIT